MRVKSFSHFYQVKHWEPRAKVEIAALDLVEKMTKYAMEKGWMEDAAGTFSSYAGCYFVGGYVRDLMFNRFKDRPLECKDIDLATPLSWGQVSEFLQSQRIRDLTVEKGVESERKNLVHRVLYRMATGADLQFEITSFRQEEGYTGHHPDKVWHSYSMREDASRRDFTMNALYFNPLTKQVIDYFGGLKDIQNNVFEISGRFSRTVWRGSRENVTVCTFFGPLSNGFFFEGARGHPGKCCGFRYSVGGANP